MNSPAYLLAKIT